MGVMMRYLGVLILWLTLLTQVLSSVDLTLEPGQTGSAVVEAVTNMIQEACQLFTDDRQMLRRIAYVESEDGDQVGSQLGGIWRVSVYSLIKNP